MLFWDLLWLFAGGYLFLALLVLSLPVLSLVPPLPVRPSPEVAS